MATGMACILAVFLAVLTITILGCIQLPTGRASLIHPDGYDTGLETCTTDMGPTNGTAMVPMETGYKMETGRTMETGFRKSLIHPDGYDTGL